jgi:hypothetical protein
MFGGVEINAQESDINYKRVGDLTQTVASPSTSSIMLKTNYGVWQALLLNTAGT